MILLIRWSWVLGIALFFPASMPAGGGEMRSAMSILSIRKASDPLLSESGLQLKSSPSLFSPPLKSLPVGTPLKLLRIWRTNDGNNWIHVQIPSFYSGNLISFSTRGWISVS